MYFNEDDAYDLAREAADVIYGQGDMVCFYTTTLRLYPILVSEDGDLVMTELLFRGFDAEVPTDLAFTEVLSILLYLISFFKYIRIRH